MNKINIKKIRSIDYRHVICAVLTLVSIYFALFYFQNSFIRIKESLLDLFDSFKFYLNELFDFKFSVNESVNEYSSIPVKLPFNLPSTWIEFKIKFSNYFNVFFTLNNLKKYFIFLSTNLLNISRILTLLLPLILILNIVCRNQIKNNNYDQDSKPLIVWKKFENNFYYPTKRWFIDFINFIKSNKTYYQLWLLIWCYNFRIVAIGIEFIAYYLYFVSSFDLISIYIQVLKLLSDIFIIIDFLGPFGISIICLYLINRYRLKVGFNGLNHLEMRNRGFINERSIVDFGVGTMGKGKTQLITDISISSEIMFRDKAFELILECDLEFPQFPWIILENSLKAGIENGIIYNLATIERIMDLKANKFYEDPKKNNIFGYDFKKYGLFFNDNLVNKYIWDTLKDYAKLYFIYIIQSSLIISNYSIRVDGLLSSLGNFPLWDSDLFKKDPKYQDAYSRHAHILDFDMLRLGKKVLIDNDKSNTFEFGIINVTEIGKERGNALELQGIKKESLYANQKNDLFNSWLKMIRHSATIRNFCFARFLCDDQRAESWGADARDLTEIIGIDNVNDMDLTMPLFSLEDLIIQILKEKFVKRYYNRRYYRGDNTLFMYLYKKIISLLSAYRLRIYNQFGYKKLDLLVEAGTQDGNVKERNYYLMFKKIYSNRYSTDCFSEFFIEKALRSEYSWDDLEEYEKTKASFEEMKQQNSYFFNDLDSLNEKINH